MDFIYLITGFVFLVIGADSFVAGASSLARKFRIPSLIVGLTVVAFGTSAPELAVSITAGFNGSNEISLGNVLGSNIFNLLMVAGVSAIFAPLVVDKSLIKRDWTASILGTILVFIAIIFDGEITRLDALLLLISFAFIIFLQIKEAITSKNTQLEDDVVDKNLKIAFLIIVGAICIVLGGEISVKSASSIARLLGVSETLIGLTVVALGTSLPELVTSVVATRKGENSIALGNIIGSNLFNIFLILGVSTAINPIKVQETAYFDVLFLLFVSIWTFILAKIGKLNKSSGILMVSTYIAYTIYIILR